MGEPCGEVSWGWETGVDWGGRRERSCAQIPFVHKVASLAVHEGLSALRPSGGAAGCQSSSLTRVFHLCAGARPLETKRGDRPLVRLLAPRGNPGGLLPEAVIMMMTIVTMVITRHLN